MKKSLFLIASLLVATFAFADDLKKVELTPAEDAPGAPANTNSGDELKTTINGVTLEWVGGYYTSDFRIYANKTITISAAEKIAQVEIAGKNNKADFTASASVGTITKGDSYAEITTDDPLIVIEGINATSITLTVTKQLRASKIVVYLGEGEVPDDPKPSDKVELEMDYAQASYWEDYNVEGLGYSWQLELGVDEDDVIGLPQAIINIYTKNEKGLAGSYSVKDETIDADYSALFVVDGADTLRVYITDGSIEISVIEVDEDWVAYEYKAQLLGDNNVTYTFDFMSWTYPYNGETDDFITLTDDGAIEEVEEGLEQVSAETMNVRIVDGTMFIPAQAGETVAVYGMNGKQIFSKAANGETRVSGLSAGGYVVRAGNRVAKVVVK